MSDYPKEQLEFVQAVYEMRQAQDRYFQNRNNAALRVAKAKEQRVDNLLRPYVSAGIVRLKSMPDKGIDTLF